MATDFDPYRILDVDVSAGQQQIDEAYRRQWAAHSGDVRLREIQAAYRILSDPAERSSYDARRAAVATAPVAVAEGSPPDIEASARLHQRVAELQQQGYELVSTTPSSANLIKKPRPQSRFRAVFWGVFWLCFGIVPLAIYMSERKSTQTRFVWLDADGLVQVGAENRDEPAWSIGDILRAIAVVIGIVVALLIPISVAAVLIAGSADKVNDSPNALAVELLASASFQAAALWAAWRFGLRKYHLNWDALGWRKPERGLPWLPFALVAWALLIVFAYGVALQVVGIEPDTDLPDAVYDHILPLSIALTLTVAIAPIIEETFFRGFVYGGLMRRWGAGWGALGSALLFGAAHLGNAGYLYVVPPIVGIGLIFAWSYRYSRSIYPSIAAHFMFNMIQMIAVLATR